MLDVGDEGGQDPRVVRQVGVDLHADVGTHVDRRPQPGAIRGAEAGLVVALDHRDAAERLAELARPVGRAVGAAVVDHDDLDRRHDGAERAEQRLDVVRLVVGRHDGHDTHGAEG